jgi:hypothetical protein
MNEAADKMSLRMVNVLSSEELELEEERVNDVEVEEEEEEGEEKPVKQKSNSSSCLSFRSNAASIGA